MGALSTYIGQVRSLLHDPNGQFWTDPELTANINEARNRVAQDTKCLRTLVTSLTLPLGQETYVPQTFLGATGPYVIDVMGITIYLTNTRVKLQYYPYTRFDALLRYWTNYQQWPIAFSRLGANTIYIGPVPNQAYPSDWDVAINPVPLASDADVETIPAPFQEPVQYYAAHKSKYKDQQMGEVEMFFKAYQRNLLTCARAWQTRIVQNPYAR